MTELFGLVLPKIDGDVSSRAQDFHGRFGFLREASRIRFRILDPALRFASLPGKPDVELDAQSFAALRLPLRRVFMTENKTNFLVFPEVEGAIVIFGSGYGLGPFGAASWVGELSLYYWGDIDTHGFAILGELRKVFPHAQSFLMDDATLLHHRNSWTTEGSPVRHSVNLLTLEEKVLFLKLQSGLYRQGVRLEQEKISFAWVTDAIKKLIEKE